MIPSLPLDLLHMIIEGVDDDQSLARLCLASKLLLSMTRPLLYRDIEIEVRERVEHDHFEGREPVPHSVHEILARSSRLVTTLTEQPALASHVRQFDFTSVRPWAEGDGTGNLGGACHAGGSCWATDGRNRQLPEQAAAGNLAFSRNPPPTPRTVLLQLRTARGRVL
ncbi:hypothetical protein JCM5353_008775 [Sporobolomyces roseus]